MAAPNMETITASLERSLQSFSLNHRTTTTTSGGDTAGESTNTHCDRSTNSSDATLELNSNITLPYHWEQCLDLKTGEMYYINWRTGMKSKEHPRMVDQSFSGSYYSEDDEEEEEEGEDEDEESSYAESESSSVESSPAASSSRKRKQNEVEDEGESRIGGGNVLVVAGCKGCFMYFMVPKQVEDCPKCCGQLLHFDRSDDN